MKTRNVCRTLLCLTQVGWLIAGNAAVLAASSTDKLDALDKQVFGETHSLMSEQSRLKELEVVLFGSEKSGSEQSRLQEISKALNVKGGDLLLPPMAPQMDYGNSLKSAPDRSSANAASSPADDTAGGEAPPASKQVLRNAMQAYSQGKTDDAERLFKQVLVMDRNNTDAYYNLGVIAEARGDLKSALTNYQAAQRLNPSENDFRDAVSTVQTKLQSQVASDQRKDAETREAAQQAQEQQKIAGLKPIVNEAATAYKAGNYDRAISNLQYVSRQAPQDSDVQYALGQAYKAKGNLDMARSAFSNALSIEPNNQLYRTAMGDLNKTASSPRAPMGDIYNNNSPGNTPGNLTAYSDSGSSGTTGGASPTPFSANGGTGGVTPFTGLDDTGGGSSFRSRSGSGGIGGMGGLSGLASAAALLGGVRMMSGGMGMGMPMGGMGMGMPMGGMGMGMPMGGMGMGMGMGMPMSFGRSSYGYNSTGTRIKRAAVGSLTGAAMGAAMGGMTHTGMGSGAMRGALMGGVMSMFTRF